MQKVAFIGSYDKADMMLYIGKIMTTIGYKVLIIDSTLLQKTKYIVPSISPTKTYMTYYEDIDVAVGFDSMEGIEEYAGLKEDEELDYDYALIDIDTSIAYEKFELKPTDKTFFVTSFDVYSLKRGVEALANFKVQVPITKVYFTRDMLPEEDDYFNFLTLACNVKWNEEIIYFPFEKGDQCALFENQRMSKIKFRNLSTAYVDSISYMTEIILECSSGEIRKAIKQIEKS